MTEIILAGLAFIASGGGYLSYSLYRKKHPKASKRSKLKTDEEFSESLYVQLARDRLLAAMFANPKAPDSVFKEATRLLNDAVNPSVAQLDACADRLNGVLPVQPEPQPTPAQEHRRKRMTDEQVAAMSEKIRNETAEARKARTEWRPAGPRAEESKRLLDNLAKKAAGDTSDAPGVWVGIHTDDPREFPGTEPHTGEEGYRRYKVTGPGRSVNMMLPGGRTYDHLAYWTTETGGAVLDVVELPPTLLNSAGSIHLSDLSWTADGAVAQWLNEQTLFSTNPLEW